MIRLLIVEDQTMILGALAALMEIEPDITVVGQASDGEDGLRRAKETQPDVVVTDIEMPKKTGLELALALKELDSRPRVIILTTFGRPGYLRRALEAGATGYLLKDAPAAELAEAVRTVHHGGRAVAPELATAAWSESDPLTDRERQVLRLAGEGKPTAAIAEQLHLSEGTVRNYLSESISKLDAANRIDAARIARNKGFL